MRPLRLTMTAFGPYAGTETVDFDRLTELGLFVVAGNNGAGKTTIFDALHYCLFGTLPGRRSTYVRLKSDHSDDRAECKVALDFVAKGGQWRIERSPKQRRPKRRGNGTTEVDRKATLFEYDAETESYKAVANKIGEVDQQCRELVGLSGKQFERVALLPQGEFSRVLQESGTERRELLRTLFSSEVFGDATSWLAERAAEAGAADRVALDRLEHEQGVLASKLSELVGRAVDTSETGLRQAEADYRQSTLVDLERHVAALEANADQARAAHQLATDTVNRIQRRNQVRVDLQAHEAAQATFRRDLARLQHARAAVPVASNARTYAQQRDKLQAAVRHTEQLQAQVNRALTTADLAPLATFTPETLTATTDTLHAVGQVLSRRAETASRHHDLIHATNQLLGEQRRADHKLSTLTDQLALEQSKLRQVQSQLDALGPDASVQDAQHALQSVQAQLAQRVELAQLHQQDAALTQQLLEFDAHIDTLAAQHDQATQAQASLASLERKADAAANAHQECVRRQAATTQYLAATSSLAKARHRLEHAQVRANELWDAFIAGTAARVADALVDDEPCPVCGSCSHPEPATTTTTDQPPSQDDVGDARDEADKCRAEVHTLELRIEALHQADADIAALSTTELNAQATTSKAMALGAQTAANNARKEASRIDQLATELADQRDRRDQTTAERSNLASRASRLQGALGRHADATVVELQTQVDQAQTEYDRTVHAVGQRSQLVATLEQANERIENIELAVLAADSSRSSVQDQLTQRQADGEQIADAVAAIDDELASFTASGHVDERRIEQQVSAVRKAGEVIATLATHTALRDDAAHAVRRAESILNERIAQSPFATADEALQAFLEPQTIELLEAQTTDFTRTGERLQGQLHELGDIPESAPDLDQTRSLAESTASDYAQANHQLIATTTTLDRLMADLDLIAGTRANHQSTNQASQRLERVAALVKGDNERNTSLENWVLAAHLRDVVDLANLRLAQSTHQRFQLCVLDDGENRRGTWGLDLGIEDTVTGTQRPTAGLSGGELFQASLALALGLADAVMNQTAGVQIDSLFIDEGFGSLDEVSVERAIDLLDELRDRGALVGVITHVPALLDALPIGVHVVDAPDGQGSAIQQVRSAA